MDCIISIIEENPESKESGLAHLCEFIEDCEHTVLATKILHLLGKEGPRTPSPSKYIRFIFNRVVLENEAVRAGKFSSLTCLTISCLSSAGNLRAETGFGRGRQWLLHRHCEDLALLCVSCEGDFYPAVCLNSSCHLSISTWSSCFTEHKQYISFLVPSLNAS